MNTWSSRSPVVRVLSAKNAIRVWPDGVLSYVENKCRAAPADSRGQQSALSISSHALLFRFVASDSHAVEGTVYEEEGDQEEGQSQSIADG